MNPPRRRRSSPAVLIAALIAVAISTFWERRTSEVSRAEPARVEQPAATAPSPARDSDATRNRDPLAALVTSDEERQALAGTLALIDRGGPFPYPQKDGSTFANREGRLPKKPRGYYQEYTVPTRGAPNRGARRVVAGRDGERWYTRDHYRSFARIDTAAPVR